MREDPCLVSEPELVSVGPAEDRHSARCHRSSELSGDPSARLMFASTEIGLHEAPAADLVEEQQ